MAKAKRSQNLEVICGQQFKKKRCKLLFYSIIFCMLSVIVMLMCNGNWICMQFVIVLCAHWQMKKKELEEMEEMFLTKKDEMSVLNSVVESKETEIYELRSMVRMWYIKLL